MKFFICKIKKYFTVLNLGARTVVFCVSICVLTWPGQLRPRQIWKRLWLAIYALFLAAAVSSALIGRCELPCVADSLIAISPTQTIRTTREAFFSFPARLPLFCLGSRGTLFTFWYSCVCSIVALTFAVAGAVPPHAVSSCALFTQPVMCTWFGNVLPYDVCILRYNVLPYDVCIVRAFCVIILLLR
jgi:hypothetical protein